MLTFAYYPGCSASGTGKENDLSARAVAEALGVQLEEIPDWNCCGASSAHSVDGLLSLALPARNLALAQKMGLDVVTPCAACYSRLRRAEHVLRYEPETARAVEEAVGFSFLGGITTMSFLEMLARKIDPKVIRDHVKHPLKGLRVACYYGCLLVRPPKVTQFDNPGYPVSMDKIMEEVGATPVDWRGKTQCCGASHGITTPELAVARVGRIAALAREAGADAFVTACPLCHTNLEMYQKESSIPVFFVTELMGMAFDLSLTNNWFSHHLIPVKPALESVL